LSEPCVLCGQTGPLADPTWSGPRIHLTCVLKASGTQGARPESREIPTTSAWSKLLHQFVLGERVKVSYRQGAHTRQFSDLEGKVGVVVGFDGEEKTIIDIEGEQHYLRNVRLSKEDPVR